ncbi:MAG: branched-chain amino acid ABC transporter permease [Beijerinckiaceae bacterium]
MSDTTRQTGTAPLAGRFDIGNVWHLLPWVLALAFFYHQYTFDGGYLGLGRTVLIAVLFTLSVDLALGYAGIVTLGHAAFYGFAAYAAGALAAKLGPDYPALKDPIIGLLFGTALAALLGFITGMLILHTEGVTIMMLTLAIAEILRQIANQWRSVTGGDDGLSGIRVTELLGVWRFDLYGKTAFLYCLAVLFVWFLISWRVVHSPFGRSLDGIRQNPRRMRAIGTPVWWRLVAMYTISAAMAGSAGALDAQTTRLVGLSVLDLLKSGIVVVMLVLGGERRLYGAFIGVLLYTVIEHYASEKDPFYWQFFIGILLMALVLFFEGGIMGIIDRFWPGRRKAKSEGGAP